MRRASLLVVVVVLTSAAVTRAQDAKQRVGSGLLALYEFGNIKGDVVQDVSGVQPPADLKIDNLKAVRRSAGRLEIKSPTIVRTQRVPRKLVNSVKKTGELSVEVWITPGKLKQSGPARILTISRDSNQRNVTIGHDNNRFDVRLRTSKTSANGIPSNQTKARTIQAKLTHLVFTRDRSGRIRIFLNGRPHSQGTVSGSTANWDDSFQLALGNELNRSRPWLGTYHLVAVYSRDLGPREVLQNFEAGPKGKTSSDRSSSSQPKNDLFVKKIAPLLGKHCFECHDPSTKKGGLDLTRKVNAFAGGENGKSIVPGKLSESLLWEYIESNEMPKDRPPLSPSEKQVLRHWIERGASWTIKELDPATIATLGKPTQQFVRRLTASEYVESVRSAIGVDITEEALQLLPRDLRADGFSNTAYNLNVDLKHIEAYAKLADQAANKLDVAKFARRYSRKRLLTDPSMQELVRNMGKWILRGPLDEREVGAFVGVSTAVASTGGDYDEAVRYIIQAMLQSPRFLYRMENQKGDGEAWPAGEYELASRISYIIWGAPPDKALMDAAERGELYDTAKVKEHVQRMLKDPRAIRRSEQFAAEWLNLGHLKNLRPNAKRYPQWNAELAKDMRSETLAFFRHIAWEKKRPLGELFNAQVTFATPRLARHYGLKPAGEGIKQYDLSKIPGRGGLLTQGSLLTRGGDEASMVSRGLLILTDVLRGSVKDPPPCVDTTPVPTKKGLTQRGIAESRIANASCGGCHSKFEPLAFGLEKYDGIGVFHNQDEHGNRLRDDGKLVIPGQEKPINYQNSAELMNLLGKSDRVAECITWKLTQFAIGRPLTALDIPIVDKIHAESRKAGGTYEHLVTAIVLSDLVQLTRTETTP